MCTLDHSLKYFSDCIYLKTHNEDYLRNSVLCEKIFTHGIIFTSKDIDNEGNSKLKTSLIIGNFDKTIRWFQNFSSAMSEKNTIIIPTEKKAWIKKYPDTVVIKLKN